MLKCVILVWYCYEALWDVTWCWHGMPLGCWCDTNTNFTLTDKWDPPKTFYFPFFSSFVFFPSHPLPFHFSCLFFFPFSFSIVALAAMICVSSLAPRQRTLNTSSASLGAQIVAHWSSSPPGIRWGETVASRVERWLIQLQTRNC